MGVSVTLVVLCLALCVGGSICCVVGAAVYQKKHKNHSSQYHPVQQAPPVNYRMSELAFTENQPEAHLFRPTSSTPSTPTPAISVNLEHIPIENTTDVTNENSGSDGNASDDEQPLIA